MPLNNPKLQSALAELQRRGVIPQETAPAAAPAAAPVPAAPASSGPDFSSPRDVERQLRLKKMKGELAIQDAINELKRRGVNLQLKTQPAVEEITTIQTESAVQNARQQGDPEAFKGAWRQLFPGRPLPRTPEGQIDYQGGQDDIDVEVDRRRKVEEAKTGARNIKEVKTTRLDPATGKEQEVLVRVDGVTGEKLGETILSENRKPVSKEQGDALKFSTILEQSRKTLEELEAKGFQPASLGTTIQGVLPNRFRSPDVQTYTATRDAWIAAHLRDVSGAAISNPEYPRAREQFFPRDGDSPEEVKRKQALRRSVEDSVKKVAGTAVSVAGPSGPLGPGPSPEGPPSSPAASSAPVDVTSAAEAPPTAKFIRSPSGRVYRNPKYTGQ